MPSTSISIHAPREGGDGRGADRDDHLRISIHAPREGGDLTSKSGSGPNPSTNPAPREGGPANRWGPAVGTVKFQSTPPAWGATPAAAQKTSSPSHFNPRPPRGGRLRCPSSKHHHGHFNPRPPRGGRRRADRGLEVFCAISIHAPREGGDGRGSASAAAPPHFNPRPPRGGRPSLSSTLFMTRM